MKRTVLCLITALLLGCCAIIFFSCADPHIHVYGEWDVTREASCSTAGDKERHCSCGAVEFEVIPAKGGCIYDTQNVCTVCEVALPYSVGLDYTDDKNGGYIVTGIGRVGTKRVVIPYYYNGKPVTALAASAFAKNETITSISIPATVTSIGKGAFDGCINLAVVELPNAVSSMGEEVFKNCSSLRTITVPDAMMALPASLFYGCESLQYVYFGEGTQLSRIGPNAFFNCAELKVISVPATVTEIGSSAFHGCEGLKAVHISDMHAWFGLQFFNAESNPLMFGHSLYLNGEMVTELTLPADMERVPDYLFRGWGRLTRLTVPAGVAAIGKESFKECTGLVEIVWEGESQITALGASAFEGCTSLRSFTVPRLLTDLGTNALGGCKGLSSIEVAAGNVKYHSRGNCLIEGDTVVLGTSGSVIPTDGSVTKIGASAFAGISNLVEISIPARIQSIGANAFDGCSKLCRVRFAANGDLRTIGAYAFANCVAMTDFTLPAYVTYLGGAAFRNCERLARVTFADNSALQMLDQYMFQNCEALVSVNFGANSQIALIRDYAFLNCIKLATVTIPASVNEVAYRAFSGCEKLKEVTFESTDGWQYFARNSDVEGTPISVKSPAENAFNLSKTYRDYEWKRG